LSWAAYHLHWLKAEIQATDRTRYQNETIIDLLVRNPKTLALSETTLESQQEKTAQHLQDFHRNFETDITKQTSGFFSYFAKKYVIGFNKLSLNY